MTDTLPPLIQELRSDASQAISEQEKFKTSTREMADTSDSESKRAGSSFSSIASGMVVANLATAALSKVYEGLHSVISTGIDQAKEQATIDAQLEAGIQSTGNAANLSVEGMNKLADSIASYSGQSADSITKTESLLQTFTNVKNTDTDKVFDKATTAAADMAAKFGGDASSNAIKLGKALNDPTNGLTALTKVGVTFTDAQKAQIAAMQASGDMAGAQEIILAELSKETGGAAEAYGKTWPGAIARAKESFAQMSGTIVTAFTPAVTAALNVAVDMFQSFAPKVGVVAEKVSAAITGLTALFRSGDFTESFREAFNVEEDSPVVDFLLNIRDTAISMWQGIQPALQSVGAMFESLAPMVEQLVPAFFQVSSAISPFQIILNALEPVLPTLIQSVGSLVTSIGGALLQALTAIAPAVSQLGTLLSGILAQLLTTLAPVITQVATALGSFLAVAVKALVPLITQLAQFIGQLLAAIMPILPPIMSLISAVLQLIAPILELVGSLLQPLIALLSAVLGPILQIVTGIVSFLLPAFTAVVSFLTDSVVPAISGIISVFQGLIDFITGVFSGNWSQAWNGIVEVFSGIWQSMSSIAAGVLNSIVDLLNGFIVDGIDGVLGTISDLTGGAISLNIPEIPHVSFDVGTDRVPGATGAALPAVVHGGEAILSNDMLAGREAIPQRVVNAVNSQTGGTTNTTTNTINVSVKTDASASRIAADMGWHLKLIGG